MARRFELTENLFGDILSDEAAVLTGSLGMLASATIGGDVDFYEPVHGSAPEIAGKNIANPLGAIWSAALMLEHLGELDAATRVVRAVESVCREGIRTGDVGGSARTSEVGDAVAARVTE